MTTPLRPQTILAYGVPSLIPLAVSMSLSLQVLIETVLIALATLSIVMIQRKLDRRAFEQDKRSDEVLRAAALLADYENDGRGWFWETDRHGILRYITPMVAERTGLHVEDIVGKQFTSLIAQIGKRDDEREERTLGFHLSSRTPFSELSIKINVDEERWWSVSGNPVLDDLGNFQGFRGSGTDLTDMRETQNAFQQLARYDTLTGLANRLEINRLLEQSLKGHMGKSEPCTLFLLDLDRFKQVNDTLGHPAGDALLVQVADRLQRVVDERGTVGRLGGDEFQIVLPKLIATADLEKLAKRIIESLSLPYIVEGSQVRIGAS
ncbi:MAG: diguanylate cyclase, partial [Sphingorhabdus sp.]|nr:diguanylate cyclase [Sphingorhabdus sp.]